MPKFYKQLTLTKTTEVQKDMQMGWRFPDVDGGLQGCWLHEVFYLVDTLWKLGGNSVHFKKLRGIIPSSRYGSLLRYSPQLTNRTRPKPSACHVSLCRTRTRTRCQHEFDTCFYVSWNWDTLKTRAGHEMALCLDSRTCKRRKRGSRVYFSHLQVKREVWEWVFL